MTTIKSLQGLSVLKNNSSEYKGKMPSYQQKGAVSKKRKSEQHRFTPYQNLLYKRAIMGLNVYTKQEQDDMHWEKRRRIKRVHRKAQSTINLLKQERMDAYCDKLYQDLFPKSKLAQTVFSSDKTLTDPKIMNTLELKFLGITKVNVVNRLVIEGILPKDFYNLKQAV